mmetsp:Transcript_27892/g.41648  ORF Transcript_27892/g.41648 Transcript_27892/m.41648 type:complete len:98 (+) Transcript_27892:83-376(+)
MWHAIEMKLRYIFAKSFQQKESLFSTSSRKNTALEDFVKVKSEFPLLETASAARLSTVNASATASITSGGTNWTSSSRRRRRWRRGSRRRSSSITWA